jgi:hypothetical protein
MMRGHKYAQMPWQYVSLLGVLFSRHALCVVRLQDKLLDSLSASLLLAIYTENDYFKNSLSPVKVKQVKDNLRHHKKQQHSEQPTKKKGRSIGKVTYPKTYIAELVGARVIEVLEGGVLQVK